MKLIVCLDERKGMMFNNRRQSRDRLLMENLERHIDGAKIYIAEYSKTIFDTTGMRYDVEGDPLKKAEKKDGYCFIESMDPSPYLSSISEVIIYYWNRHYPSDMCFTMDMSAFSLASTEEFVGSSHEKITKEVWKR